MHNQQHYHVAAGSYYVSRHQTADSSVISRNLCRRGPV